MLFLSILKKLVSEYNNRIFGETTLKIRYVDSSQPLQPTFNFGDEIKTEIDNFECVLAIVTTNSRKSTWVNQEIGYALGKGIPLLPVKKNSMASRGCEFLHSNIDSQIIADDQLSFPRINLFFKQKFKKSENEAISVILPLYPPNFIIMPVAFYVQLHQQIRAGNPVIRYGTNGDSYYVGTGERLRILWSNKFINLNEILIGSSERSTWYYKPHDNVRLKVEFMEEDINNLALLVETVFKFVPPSPNTISNIQFPEALCRIENTS